MSLLKYLLPTVAAAVAISTTGFAATPETESDISAVKDFMRAKRSVSVREKGGELNLSGDVRFEYQSVTESINGTPQRGSGTGNSNHDFDTEVNLMFDYKADNSWAGFKLEFDNDAGNRAGTSGNIDMERAFVGYNVMEEDTARLDVEIGRWNMYDLFESKVQFASRFDGLLLRYANSMEEIGDFYLTGGIFTIDQVTDQFGWVTEFGVMDVADTGLYAKYSYIDWDQSGVDNTGQMNSWTWKSRNSQLVFGYAMTPEMLRTDVNLYGGYLMNHAAKKRTITNNKKENKAWYLGARFGKLEFAGDWSLDLNYQSVQAQAVLDTEALGIGRGNIAGSTFATAATAATARGNANYKGWAAEGAYAMTDHLTFTMEYESANAEDKNIGGRNSYHKFEVEVIYGF